MSTAISPAIEIPNKVETCVGMLQFIDGFPYKATSEKRYHNLDFQRPRAECPARASH